VTVKSKTVLENRVVGVLVDLNEGSAIEFVAHRGYDRLLCKHVYFGFCAECPLIECGKRRL
jgi:hypothetical protein